MNRSYSSLIFLVVMDEITLIGSKSICSSSLCKECLPLMDGINYRAEAWVNGILLSTINGMFIQDCY